MADALQSTNSFKESSTLLHFNTLMAGWRYCLFSFVLHSAHNATIILFKKHIYAYYWYLFKFVLILSYLYNLEHFCL